MKNPIRRMRGGFTLIELSVAMTMGIMTGSLVVETIFGLPGLGRYLVQGALNRDYTLVMGMVVVYATAMILLNLAVDIAYAWLDPRTRPSGAQ